LRETKITNAGLDKLKKTLSNTIIDH
jgi:hypothetical protein